MLIGAAFAVSFACTILFPDPKKHPNSPSYSQATIAIWITVSALLGAGVAILLSLRDVVEERQTNEKRPSRLVRIYFGKGWVSLLIWFITIIVLSIPVFTILFGFLGL